jgi:hypothetical protein
MKSNKYKDNRIKKYMSYNTNFKVKYHDIQEELLLKLKDKDDNNNDINNEKDEEYKYTTTDIIAICNKLYCDELASVFFAQNILDDKIDIGIKEILEKIMVENVDFKQIILDINHYLKWDGSINCSDYYVFMILFSQDIFWITHQCICQQLTTNTIEKPLLEILRKHTVEIL